MRARRGDVAATAPDPMVATLASPSTNLDVCTAPAATLLVCVTCKSGEEQVGAAFYRALGARFAGSDVALRAVACLSVCKRPCTVALAAPGKWTYVVGDLDACDHLDDIVTAARRYAETPDGLVPWRERPLPFRKGVVSRTPPLAPAFSD
jgi:predicted metal-binding protein